MYSEYQLNQKTWGKGKILLAVLLENKAFLNKTETSKSEFWRQFTSCKNTSKHLENISLYGQRYIWWWQKLGKDWRYVNKQHRNLMWRYLISGWSVRWRLENNIKLRSQTGSQLWKTWMIMRTFKKTSNPQVRESSSVWIEGVLTMVWWRIFTFLIWRWDGYWKDKRHKSPDIDQFLAVFIKAGDRKIRCQIRKLINSIWIYDELPEE